jgi:hypothetical protein
VTHHFIFPTAATPPRLGSNTATGVAALGSMKVDALQDLYAAALQLYKVSSRDRICCVHIFGSTSAARLLLCCKVAAALLHCMYECSPTHQRRFQVDNPVWPCFQ